MAETQIESGGPIYKNTASVAITQALLEEKNELQRALFAVQEALQTAQGEKEQMHKLFTDVKSHLATTQGQCADY
jgi:hypothetical protein